VNRELIIDSTTSEVNIALLEDKNLVELHKEQNNNNFAVGDIFLGKVKKIMPGLNAAFVDVGYEKDAFLHYLDLGPQIRTFNKYIKLCIQGRAQQIPHDQFKPERDIEKTGKMRSKYHMISSNRREILKKQEKLRRCLLPDNRYLFR